MTADAAPAPHRYQALDALRGICALCVCLFHFRAAGPLPRSDFVHGSWLFVDFFFVLSGFVIAANYRDRLISGGFMRRFIVLRFGRVYPLHLVMLLAFIVMEVIGLMLHSKGLMQRAPFAGPTAPSAIITNIALLQVFGLHPGLTWNGPSWSIAAEFWTYILFALAARQAGQALEKWLVAAALASVAVLLVATPHGINVSHDWSLFRCVYGFVVGAIAWRWWSRRGLGPQPMGNGATLVELTSVAAVIGFVSFAGDTRLNLFAPLVFGGVLLVFAREGGGISRVLRMAVPQWLGLLSYSIYMVHTFVQSRLDGGLRLIGKALHVSLTTHVSGRDGLPIELAGATAAQGTALTLVMLALVVITAAATQWLVERPGQQLAKRRADRFAASPIDASTADERR